MRSTVSLIILTLGRKNSVEKSLSANLESADYPVHELIHVDNGSPTYFNAWFKATFSPNIQILHRENVGVPTGYNRGLLLATGDYVVITGCDRVMPDRWLAKAMDAFKAIPNTGVISFYSTHDETRYMDKPEVINDVLIQKAFAFEAKIHSRDFLYKAGFYREDFGLYGYSDCEYVNRCHRIAEENGLINYVLPELGLATHLSSSGDNDLPILGGKSYSEFKASQRTEDKKNLVQKLYEAGSPYYNPYARMEK